MAKNWLDKYNDGGPVQENYNDAQTSYPPAFVGQGTFNGPMFNNGAVKGQFAMGGSLPGSVGFTYARTGSTPSNGKYAKKTLPSAQNGQEMSFYQHGLDWNPKMISKNGSVIKDDNGYWNPDNWGHPVEINSNNITMQGVHQPLLGISDTGHTQLMHPGEDYKFKGKKVTEFPIAQNGKKLPNNQPTTQDSLDIYNNTKALENYYKNYKLLSEGTILKDEQKEALDNFREKLQFNNPPKTNRRDHDFDIKESEYYQKIDNNKFKQRDNMNAVLDLRSPMGLYDKRIAPTIRKTYMHQDPRLGFDAVNIDSYDPIAVKPYNMLTPAEKVIRDEKYPKPKQQSVTKPNSKPTQQTKKNNEPIVVNNPNDPRLKAYNDSLNLHNSGEDYYNRLKNLSFGNSPIIKISEENLKKARDENYKKYPWDKLNMPIANEKSGKKFQPTSKYEVYVSDVGGIESNRYKKPVQPVVYQKEQTRPKPGKGEIVPIEHPNLQQGQTNQGFDRNLSPIDVKEQPTNWSFHYPIEGTFDRGNPQGVKYFKDRAEWQNFLDENDYNSAEEKNGIGQASGTLKKGRNGLRQEQKSLQNLDNLLNFTNYNTPQPGGWMDKYTS